MLKVKMKDYGVKAMPTTIIDGKINVTGISDFPWICGEDLYKILKRDIHQKDNNNHVIINNTKFKLSFPISPFSHPLQYTDNRFNKFLSLESQRIFHSGRYFIIPVSL